MEIFSVDVLKETPRHSVVSSGQDSNMFEAFLMLAWHAYLKKVSSVVNLFVPSRCFKKKKKNYG